MAALGFWPWFGLRSFLIDVGASMMHASINYVERGCELISPYEDGGDMS